MKRLANDYGVLEKVMNIGMTEEIDLSASFILKLINIIAVAGIFFTIASLFTMDMQRKAPAATHILLVFFCVLTIYFNAKYCYKAAKLSLLLAVPSVQAYTALFLDSTQSGVELTIIPFICFSAFAFADRKAKLLAVFYLSSILMVSVLLKGYHINNYIVYNLVLVALGVAVGVYLLLSHLQMWGNEVKAKNEKLKEQNKKLEGLVQQNKLKTELLGIISHDLKGPVQSFDKLAEKATFLLRNNEYDTLLEMADYFESSSKKLFLDIEQLLDWTISQKGYIKTYLKPIRLLPQIESILDLFEHNIISKEITIRHNISENLTIISDEHLTSIVLKNIIDNAIKYSPPKSKVEIKYFEKEKMQVLQIIDEGPGIDPSLISKIAEGQLEKSHSGYGIGISISLSLIKTLKGSLTFKKTKSVGSVAEILLPSGQEVSFSGKEGVAPIYAEKMDQIILN